MPWVGKEDKRCENCCFYDDSESVPPHSGLCRRYPPLSIGAQYRFSRVDADIEWCGEFKRC